MCLLLLCKYVTDILKMCMKKFNDDKIFLINLKYFTLGNIIPMHMMNYGL